MLAEGKKFDYLLDPIDFNISDHAYVVYDQNYSSATTKIKKYLDKIGVHSIGRFGEWEYYNMDICMQSAMNLVNFINTRIEQS